MTLQPKNDRASWLQGPSAQCSALPETAKIPWRLVLLGAPGVGKGTQAGLLNHWLHACHLSTGDVLRTVAQADNCMPTPAMSEALEYMVRGALVPDSTMWQIVRERRPCLRCGGFILDGFPRTFSQAVSLKDLLESEGLGLTAVVNYDLGSAEIIARLGGRRICDQCKRIFHVDRHPPKLAGICDRCGGDLFQREDDRPASIAVRLEAYARSTAPLIEFYEKLGLLIHVDANGSPEDVCEKTLSALEFYDHRPVLPSSNPESPQQS